MRRLQEIKVRGRQSTLFLVIGHIQSLQNNTEDTPAMVNWSV
jgi:hypothetical protein